MAVVGGTGVAGYALLLAEINKLQADLAAMRTALNSHTHSGVTVGAGTSGAISTPLAALTSTQLTPRQNDGI